MPKNKPKSDLCHVDLFSGIGGFALAARWAGIKTVQFVEIDHFCHKVLNKNFPGVPIHDDIKTFKYNGTSPFILTGGFPCQPFSCAGKRRGKEDDRFLWPEMLRVVSEVKSRWIIGENVAGFIDMGLDDCISDLENQGYEVQTFIIPACAVNAPHRRDRVWICAHSLMCEHGTGRGQISEKNGLQGINRAALCAGGIIGADSHAADTTNSGIKGLRRERENSISQYSRYCQFCDEWYPTTSWKWEEGEKCPDCGNAAHTSNQRLQGSEWTGSHEQRQAAHGSASECNRSWSKPWPEVATRLCGVAHGLPRRVDRVNRLKALGNAIVPQVAFQIMKSIFEVEFGK